MRKALSILLSVLLLAFTMSALSTASLAAESFSGKCGDNITWTLENGTLTLSGTGNVEKQTREVDGKYYVNGYYDESGRYVEGHYETGLHTESYYPWVDVMIRMLLDKLGYASTEEAEAAYESGAITDEEIIEAEDELSYNKVVIGEGITGMDSDLLNYGFATDLVLPTTFNTVQNSLYLYDTKTIVIKNPSFDFEANQFLVVGFRDGLFFETMEEFNEANNKANHELYETNLLFLYDLASLFPVWQTRAEEFAAQAEEVSADESKSPQEKETALAELRTLEGVELQNWKSAFERMKVSPATFSEAVTAAIEFYNIELGTSFENFSELYYSNPDGTCGLTEAFWQAMQPMDDRKASAEAIINGHRYYPLGQAPEFETGYHYIDENGNSVGQTEQLIPAPWLTVYAPENSTAQKACEISKVKFAVWEEPAAETPADETPAPESPTGFSKLIQTIRDFFTKIADFFRSLFR